MQANKKEGISEPDLLPLSTHWKALMKITFGSCVWVTNVEWDVTLEHKQNV